MRKLIIILLISGIVGFGAYSAMWFIQAGQARTQLENALKEAKNISYESISVSGYPKDIMLSLNNPRFKGRIDTIIGSSVNLPEWDMDISIDGNISFSINAFSDRYSIASAGNWHIANNIGGALEKLISKNTGYSVCSLRMERSQGWYKDLWNMQIVRDQKKILDDFRELDCSLTASQLTEEESNDVLISNAPSQLYISNFPDNNSRKGRLYLKLADYEITAAGDKFFEPYEKLFSPQSRVLKASDYGKQNIEADLIIQVPSEINGISKDTPFDFNLAKLTINNQVYNIDYYMQASNSLNAESRLAKFYLKANSTYSEKYSALLQDLLRESISGIYAKRQDQIIGNSEILEKYTPDQLYEMLLPLVPNFYSQGKISQFIDFSYSGNKDMSEGNASLAAFDISSSLYGINATGNVNIKPGAFMPASSIKLICSNCVRLIEDIADYATRVQKTLLQLEPESPASFTVDPSAVDGLKKFLSELSQPPADEAGKNNFIFEIASDSNMGFTVNNKTPDKIMALYSENMSKSAGQKK